MTDVPTQELWGHIYHPDKPQNSDPPLMTDLGQTSMAFAEVKMVLVNLLVNLIPTLATTLNML